MMNEGIAIRPLTDLNEVATVERLQKIIWHIGDLEVTPVHALHAIQDNGGLLAGAFDGDEMVGFVLGIIGLTASAGQPIAERLKLYSMEAGVLPAYQSRGVGYQLKLFQRRFALDLGLDLITWTYDPLESRNGRFNIGKLGAICNRYRRNFHGQLSGINAGLTTDRFEVAWPIASQRVKKRLGEGKRPLTLTESLDDGAILLNPVSFNQDGLPVPPHDTPAPTSDALLVEIPADIQAVKRQDFALAQLWRQHTRQLFENLFKDGFVVADFVIGREGDGRRRSFYWFVRTQSLVED